MDTAQRSYGPGFWPAAIAEKTDNGIRPQVRRGIGERADGEVKGLNNVDNDENIEEESSDTSEEEGEPSGAAAAAGDGEQAVDGDPEDEDGAAEDADGDVIEDDEPGERMDADPQEEAPVKVKRDPAMPTAEERQKHDIAHLPPRPWCPVCVDARAIEAPHKKQSVEQKLEGLPSVSVDYCEVGENPEDTDDRQVCLVARDKWTTTTWARLVSCKGRGDVTVVKELLKFTEELGYDEMEIKGDGEPALVDIMQNLKETRRHVTKLRNPPAHDP